MAESEGFEPPDPRGSTVFKTAAFDHSASSPVGCLTTLKVDAYSTILGVKRGRAAYPSVHGKSSLNKYLGKALSA